MNGWQVYILECGDGSFYTGVTNDIISRIIYHNRGYGSKYVRGKKAKRLLAVSCLMEKERAMRLEYSIKNYGSKTKDEKINKVIHTWHYFYKEHKRLLKEDQNTKRGSVYE